jgi:hypothetical protein
MRFGSDVFKGNYLPLLAFTGRWSARRDDKDPVDVIQLEAYFRNALPEGDYPYPIWHDAGHWASHESMNCINLYLDATGAIFLVTRSADSDEAHRGPYEKTVRSNFDGRWQWTDATGQAQPRAMLLSARFHLEKPHVPKLNSAYRSFASEMRQGSCLSCHTPSNSAEAERLVLLQTPLHAAGEIESVIRSVSDSAMRKTK